MVPVDRASSAEPARPAEGGRADDAGLIEALRKGDEAAFRALVDRYTATLLRLASMYASNTEVAADVVQETWIGVLQGIDRFEERSSLKTWICRILVNKAKTAAQREGRTITFSDLDDELVPAVGPERFHDQGPNRGKWSIAPQEWDRPEERLLSKEARPLSRGPSRLFRRTSASRSPCATLRTSVPLTPALRSESARGINACSSIERDQEFGPPSRPTSRM
jgi:RNA polymerase sigma factor (sigma-70 family)